MRTKSRRVMAAFVVCLLIAVIVQNAMAAELVSGLPGGVRNTEEDPWGIVTESERIGVWNPLRSIRPTMDGWNLAGSFRMIEAWNGKAAACGQADVVITWSAPPQLMRSQQVVKYNVYRSSTDRDLFQAKNRLNDFPLTKLTINDRVLEGHYYYGVQAILADGTAVSSDPMEANVVAVAPPAQVGTQPATTENSVPSSGGGPLAIYMMVDGIPGSITEGGFAGGSYVLSYEWGVTHAEGSTAPTLGTLTVLRNPDSTSVPLAEAFYLGNSIPKVTMTVCHYQAGYDRPFYRLVLTNVKVANYEVERGDQVGVILEKITLGYEGLKVQGYESEDPAMGISNTMLAVDYLNGSVIGPEPSTRVPASSHGAVQARAPKGTYLTMTDIPGPATTGLNVIKNAMEVSDFQFASDHMVIKKRIDPASVRLVTACLSGQRVPTAVLEIAGKFDCIYYRVSLTDVKVIGVSSSSSALPNQIPMEVVELSYAGIMIEYRSIGGAVNAPVFGPWVATQYLLAK
ncbi:MAG: type VI secretion system tube protein Hcp [Bacillota bacterium]